MNKVFEFGAAVLLALVPSIILYWFFEDSNIAELKWKVGRDVLK
jgi:hypothetical protein